MLLRSHQTAGDPYKSRVIAQRRSYIAEKCEFCTKRALPSPPIMRKLRLSYRAIAGELARQGRLHQLRGLDGGVPLAEQVHHLGKGRLTGHVES